MKRLIAAALLFVFLVSVCVTGRLAVGTICDNAEELLKQSLKSSNEGNWDEAKKTAERISDYLNERHVLLSAFSNSGEIDELMLCCELLLEAAQKQDQQEFSRHRRTAKHLLYKLKKGQKLNAESFV